MAPLRRGHTVTLIMVVMDHTDETLQEELARLTAELSAAVERRRFAVEYAQQYIREANERFDREAVRLNRLRAKVREQLPKDKPPEKWYPPELVIDDGFTEQDEAHYLELLRQKGR